MKNVKESWPEKGTIKFENVVLRYDEDSEVILKGVSLEIQSGEKIGIIGRTGSGKSTLLIALLRIVEMQEGRILIDDTDIQKIALKRLRSKVAIILQEPVLFEETLRTNLDPFSRSTDREIWHALDSVELSDEIGKLPEKLDTKIKGHSSFSFGQKQLLCIARAILMDPKILVLDEATAGIDPLTDQQIQRAILDNFQGKTVLTIAHRLDTVMTSDKILVMDNGRVVEFDTPFNLMSRNGYFKSLVEHKRGLDRQDQLP